MGSGFYQRNGLFIVLKSIPLHNQHVLNTCKRHIDDAMPFIPEIF